MFVKRAMISIFSILLIMILLTSCASRCNVSTNTFVDFNEIPKGFPIGTSFAVIPLQENNPLFSKEIKRKLEKLLEEKGFFVSQGSQAKYTLLFDFSISSFSETVTVPKYIPGQTQTTQGSVYGNYGGYGSYNQTTSSSGTTVYVPETCVFFRRTLDLQVYDAKLLEKNKAGAPVWSGNTVSVGSCGDLREVIDYILIPAFEYFGKNTGKRIDMQIALDDETVEKFRCNLQNQ